MSNETIPRRIDISRNLPVELAIRKAMSEIEELGADVKLTFAVIKLDEVLNLVADYIDENLINKSV